MSLREYRDEFVQGEVGTQFGAYFTSFVSEDERVEIHLFRGPADVVAFITMSVGFPVVQALSLAKEAVATKGPSEEARFVFDANSFTVASASR